MQYKNKGPPKRFEGVLQTGRCLSEIKACTQSITDL